MAEDKIKKNEAELDDEQLNEVNGGGKKPATVASIPS